ncbi:PREDICTED: DNA (cytosine-5)-methyltransferase CMT3-like isoform X2 [Camelina sativa]|uniref:DNA (cytosine-5-)-methyltransferase n=1 Tax=Camelina sativa TaxID=90675 RepID=A0ABM0SSU4_CAMSA|nr:PREDICTED: DNA (cytosine-5)-methyltransferase CMT3-like isoform X2 [Camelina sativa]
MAPKRKRAPKNDDDTKSAPKPRKRAPKRAKTVNEAPVEVVEEGELSIARFLDEPIPESEAKTAWPDRYKPIEVKKPVARSRGKKKDDDVVEIIRARCHFRRAIVDESITYELNDDAYVQAGEGNAPYICKIVEMFEGANGKLYFAAQWFYRASDTVIGNLNALISDKRVFFSKVRDTNELGTLVKKLEILMISLNENTTETIAATKNCDYYCDMNYLLPYSTFEAFQEDTKMAISESSTISSDNDVNGGAAVISEDDETSQANGAKREATLLDLYCGCGAMSTGLCMGAKLAGLNLVTKWAVDMNEHACKSLEHNHPETQVRNMSAENFLLLLKEWEKLCIHFSLRKSPNSEEYNNLYGMTVVEDDEDEDDSKESDNEDDGEVFTVAKIVGITFGDLKNIKKSGLYLKVRWLGYAPSHDTWEPIEGLSNCREKIKEFVESGYKSGILPLQGGVDVICGGPPCQGISGHNRFRNTEEPLNDEKNKQLLVYMNIVEFLKPKYVLMENVVDMLKFAKGYLARYAVGRLIQMNYQSRMGMMAAGAYGLAQFRMRFFLCGALSSEMLPQFPLPTHDVVMRGNVPVEFERNTVAYNEGHTVKLADKLLLEDIISDLPAIANSEVRDEIPYDKDPITPFQQFIRLRKDVLGSSTNFKSKKHVLYDHHPLNLNIDDYQRVCRVPKKKGANFRDFPGVIVGRGNVVHLDESMERVMLESGNPLVPDYAVSYVDGTSSKPFGRLWWDETVPTVVTRAEPHNQVIIHPQQDRVLSIRENARLQGFPDDYKLFGPPKQKYIQVGNAVAVPVAKALGYALAMAFQGLTVRNDDPLLTLPEGFAHMKP